MGKSTSLTGFPTGVANMGELLSQYMRGTWAGGGGLKMVLQNTCEEVHLLVKFPAISLQACKFTKNKLLQTFFKDFS